jgi:hypothetical protein
MAFRRAGIRSIDCGACDARRSRPQGGRTVIRPDNSGPIPRCIVRCIVCRMRKWLRSSGTRTLDAARRRLVVERDVPLLPGDFDVIAVEDGDDHRDRDDAFGDEKCGEVDERADRWVPRDGISQGDERE